MSLSSLNFVVSHEGHTVSLASTSIKNESISFNEWGNFKTFCTKVFGEANNEFNLVEELDFSPQHLKDEAFVNQITEDFVLDCYQSYVAATETVA